MNRDDAIISRFDDPPGTVYAAVEQDQLEGRSYRGFTLAAVIYEDQLVAVEGDESRPDRRPQHGFIHDPPTVGHVAPQAVVVRRARYLMRQDAESALAKLHLELEAANELRTAAYQRDRERERLDAEQEKETKKLRTELQTARDNYAAVVRSREADLTARRKLETDIGKLRGALGDLRMKEILGS